MKWSLDNQSWTRYAVLLSGLLVLSLMCSSLFYCEKFAYEPSGANPVEVAPSTASTEVNFGLDDENEIKVWGDATISYSLAVEVGRIKQIVLWLDDHQLWTQSSPRPFTVETGRYSDGVHELKAVVTLYTEGASLAAQAGVEYTDTTFTAAFHIDNSLPDKPLKILSAVPYEGRLRLTWEKYEKMNFESYVLYYVYGDYDRRRVAVISNADSTFWDDPNFNGGYVQYALGLNAADKYLEDAVYVYEDQPLMPSAEQAGPHAMRIFWDESLYYKNVTGYHLRRRPRSEDSENPYMDCWDFEASENIRSVIDDRLVAGQLYEYWVYEWPLGFTYRTEYDISIDVYLGKKCKPVEKIYAVPQNQAIVVSGPEGAELLSADDRQTIHQIDDPVVASSSGGTLYALVEPAYGYTDRVARLNTQTLAVEEEISLAEIAGHLGQLKADLSQLYVNDSHVLFFRGQGAGAPLYAADLVTKTLLDSVDISEDFKAASNTVTYLLAGNDYWQFSSNHFEKTGFIPQADAFCFTAGGGAYVSTSGGEAVLRRSSDFAVQKRFAIENDLLYPSVDAYMGHVGGYCSAYSCYRVYDLNTGSLLMEEPVVLQEDSYRFLMASGLLFYSPGACLDLNL